MIFLSPPAGTSADGRLSKSGSARSRKARNNAAK